MTAKQWTTRQPNVCVIALGLFLSLLWACASQPFDQLNLMPAPDVYGEDGLDPFTDRDPIEDIPYGGILYATDREPAQGEGKSYLNERGHVVRLGVARIRVGKKDTTWEEARRISLLKNRTENYPLKVTGIDELGVLDRSVNVFTEDLANSEDPSLPAREFAAKINAKLAVSRHKDIFIYVHGYKVVFENPLLVASELWHFLGYEGAFIAFAWPSTPSTFAYVSDLETADLSAGNLRTLLEYLAKNTNAEQIHVIGYSAGTRVVTDALHQIALMYRLMPNTSALAHYRLGHVILTGSDIDRHIFGAYLVDGLLDTAEDFTVYMSSTDKALNVSNWLFGRQRLGQAWQAEPAPIVVRFLQNNEKLRFINATEAAGAATGNGHAYFRKSPWTSSDILTTLLYDLAPAARGLEQPDGSPIWRFPSDYIEKLRKALTAAGFEEKWPMTRDK